jgi:hypothetical protein
VYVYSWFEDEAVEEQIVDIRGDVFPRVTDLDTHRVLSFNSSDLGRLDEGSTLLLVPWTRTLAFVKLASFGEVGSPVNPCLSFVSTALSRARLSDEDVPDSLTGRIEGYSNTHHLLGLERVYKTHPAVL